jgi:hypothetical protein
MPHLIVIYDAEADPEALKPRQDGSERRAPRSFVCDAEMRRSVVPKISHTAEFVLAGPFVARAYVWEQGDLIYPEACKMRQGAEKLLNKAWEESAIVYVAAEMPSQPVAVSLFIAVLDFEQGQRRKVGGQQRFE